MPASPWTALRDTKPGHDYLIQVFERNDASHSIVQPTSTGQTCLDGCLFVCEEYYLGGKARGAL
jgi:hypothetical protein